MAVAWESVKATAEAAFKAGEFAAAAGGYQEALHVLSAASSGAPPPADAAKLLSNQSAALQRLGDWQAAVACAQQACELQPRWEKAFYRLGSAYLGAGDSAAAQAAFERGLELKPGNRQLMEALASAKAGSSSSKTSSSGGGGGQAGKAAAASGGPLQAAAENRAQPAAAAAGKPSPPVKQDSAVGLMPPTPQPSAADVTAAAGGTAAAAVSPPTSARGGGSDGGSAAVAGAARGADLEEAAVKLAEAQKAAGNEAFKEGRYEEAARCFTAALQLRPGTAVYLGNRAAAHLMGKRYADALSDSLAAVAADPDFARGYARAAKAEMLQGRFERAEELYRQAARRDPAQQRELAACQIVARKVQLAREALEGGDAQHALALAEAAVAGSAPPAEPALRLRVEALLALGRHAEAVAEARALTAGGDANAPEVLALRSRALYLCGNLTMSQALYQQALRRDPDCVPAQRGLKRLRSILGGKERGNAAFQAGAWQEAHDHYSRALEADPELVGLKSQHMAQVACNRAAAAAKLGRHRDALADAELAIELDAGYAKAYVRRAQAHQELGSLQDAVRDYEKAGELQEDYPGLREMLREAQLALKKAQRVDYYGVLGVDHSVGEDELKRAYRKAALRTHPDKAGEGEREAAEARFKLVGEAYAALSDPQQRRRYDAGWSLEEINQGFSSDAGGFPGGFGGGGFAMGEEELLFAQMFGGRMGGGGGGGGGFGRSASGRHGFPGYASYPGGGGGGFGGGGGYGYRPF